MYCSKCGSTIAETVTVCPVCGQQQGAGIPLPPAPLLQPTGPAHVTPDWQPAPVVAYAGFWLRFVASLLDGFITGVPIGIVVVILILSSGLGSFLHNLPNPPDPGEAAGEAFGVALAIGIGVFILLAIVGNWLYYTAMESSRHQATLGKKALGIIVTDMSGNRISFARANGRFFGKWISGMILNIGYLMAAFTEKKQALHDILASCLVVMK